METLHTNSESKNMEEGEESSTKEKAIERDQTLHKEMLSDVLKDQIKGVIYGNCIGDAIGLLTEFMSKEQAQMVRTITLGSGKSGTEQVVETKVKSRWGEGKGMSPANLHIML